MFDSANQALAWAYNIEGRPIVKMSAINHMRQEPAKCAQNMLLLNLTAEDRHGQAALIIGMVEKLPDPAEVTYLAAQFGRRLTQDELRLLVFRGCEALGVGLEKSLQEAVYRIMLGYFGKPMGYRQVQGLLRCRDVRARMTRDCLYDTLDIIHSQAMADITEVLEEHGLIKSTHLMFNQFS